MEWTLDWRRQHFKSSMDVYYRSFLPYMKMAKIDMNFEEFLADVNDYRKFGLILSSIALPVIFNPDPDQNLFNSFGKLNNFFKWRNEIFSKPIDESEDDLIKETNRRLLDNIIETYELGYLK